LKSKMEIIYYAQ